MGYSATDLSELLGGTKVEPVASAIPATMAEAELSAFLGLSSSRIRTLAADGIFVRSSRGRFDVGISVRNYVARLQEGAARAGRPSEGGDDLKAEKLRLTRAQADKEETRVKREAGDLVEAEAVTREWASILRDLRNALLAVPSRCGAVLPHLTATDTATLDREIRKALEAVANGN